MEVDSYHINIMICCSSEHKQKLIETGVLDAVLSILTKFTQFPETLVEILCVTSCLADNGEILSMSFASVFGSLK